MSAVEAALSTAVATMAGVVAFLFNIFYTRHVRLEKKVDECEEDRRDLWKQLATINPNCQPKAKAEPSQ